MERGGRVTGWGRGVNDCGRGGENRNKDKNKNFMWFVVPGTT